METLLDVLTSKIISGEINSDDAAIELDENGIEVTENIYTALRQTEAKYLKIKNGLQIGDIVTITGKNGNADFTANYRGIDINGKYIVVVKGLQISVEKSDLKC